MIVTRPRGLAVLLLLTALTAWPARAGSAVPAGCSSRVVAHTAGQKAARAELPYVCATTTGYATSEPAIAVTPRGTVVISPAQSENTSARSTDGGRTWGLTAPAHEQYTSLWNTVDPSMTVDPRTGRDYLVHATGPTRTTPLLVDSSPFPGAVSTTVAAAAGFQLYSSGDEGRTWTTTDMLTAPTGDWEKVFVGRSRDGRGSTVYVCGNAPFEVSGPGRLCYRSHDGGRTFAVAGFVFPSVEQAKYCPPLAADNGSVGPDGTVYQPVTCTDGAYVAVSSDEGTTYTWYGVPGSVGSGFGIRGAGFQVAADPSGTVWASWIAGDHLQLSRSRDHGAHWQSVGDVAAPGSHHVTLAQLAAGPAGDVGLVYYAAARAGQSAMTAWITETHQGNAARPVFVSGALNDPRHPTFTDFGLAGPSPRADYIGACFDRRGRLWGAAVRQTSGARADGTIGTMGVVGHLG
ncbi:MAG: hypothetical protein JWM40_1328 [Frankiales bacterium]|nr:hypothetical protein [Frankiales bacterium]